MSDVLLKHGTQAFLLSPSCLIATAKADIARRVANQAAWKDETATFQHYAFHRKHVTGAKDARDLLARAMTDRLRGAESNKRSCLLIYSDAAALEAAWRAAGGE